jgi:hypothetical protein
MSQRLPVLLGSVLALTEVVKSSPRPADPTITAPALLPRQQPANFIGWGELNGTCMPVSIHSEPFNRLKYNRVH